MIENSVTPVPYVEEEADWIDVVDTNVCTDTVVDEEVLNQEVVEDEEVLNQKVVEEEELLAEEQKKENHVEVEPRVPLVPVQTHNTTWKNVSYFEATGRNAGTTILENTLRPEEVPPKQPELDSENPWAPFKSAAHYALVKWWFKRVNASAGAIDDFIKDPDLEAIKILTGITSYDECLQLIHAIPYGISFENEDVWMQKEVSYPEKLFSDNIKTGTLYYRDLIESIRFLLGHKPFAKNTTWAPIQLFQNNTRVYNEMYTATWWWQTQDKLPDGATLVPIIIGVDKTLLTAFRGDLSAWPVYLTVGNLTTDLRYSQIEPSKILLALLPIPKFLDPKDPSNRKLRAELYQSCMAIIFKRRLPNHFHYDYHTKF